GALARIGLESARGDVLVLAYSDDTFSPRDLTKFLVYLRDADLVIGTRTTRQMIEQGTNMRGVVRAGHVVLAKLVELLWWRFESLWIGRARRDMRGERRTATGLVAPTAEPLGAGPVRAGAGRR